MELGYGRSVDTDVALLRAPDRDAPWGFSGGGGQRKDTGGIRSLKAAEYLLGFGILLGGAALGFIEVEDWEGKGCEVRLAAFFGFFNKLVEGFAAFHNAILALPLGSVKERVDDGLLTLQRFLFKLFALWRWGKGGGHGFGGVGGSSF